MSPAYQRPSGGNQPIIVADADEENASHVERQLRRSGVENPVVVMQNGDDLHAFLMTAALEDEPKPCALFLDPRMPGANGFDPVRWVKREKCFVDMTVVIFSTPDQPDEIEIAGELGVHLFLKKHPDLGSLAKVVEHLCGAPPAEAPELPTVPVK